jgi:DNA-binding Xre family transcriptional regulator
MFKNRVAKYFNGTANANTLDDGGEILMVKTSATAELNGNSLTPAEQAIAQRTAGLLQKAIKRKWRGKDKQLAIRADIDASKLSVLKMHGTYKVIPSLEAVCHVLGIDPEKLIEGKLVDVTHKSRRPDLHSMLEALVGTPNEPAVEQVLKAFLKASEDSH